MGLLINLLPILISIFITVFTVIKMQNLVATGIGIVALYFISIIGSNIIFGTPHAVAILFEVLGGVVIGVIITELED